jgi:hypothetical protein
MAYRPHLFEKNQNRTPSAFLEGLDDRYHEPFAEGGGGGAVTISSRL